MPQLILASELPIYGPSARGWGTVDNRGMEPDRRWTRVRPHSVVPCNSCGPRAHAGVHRQGSKKVEVSSSFEHLPHASRTRRGKSFHWGLLRAGITYACMHLGDTRPPSAAFCGLLWPSAAFCGLLPSSCDVFRVLLPRQAGWWQCQCQFSKTKQG